MGEQRHSGIARVRDESGEHKGLYLSSGWLKALGVLGPLAAIGVGALFWLAGRPDRNEVNTRIRTVRHEIRTEMMQLRTEIRQDISDLRGEIRQLIRQRK